MVGTGEQNAAEIVTALDGLGETGKAAKLCDALSEGGYGDWFLPFKDEFNKMYVNLHQESVGWFANYYWSSSELGSDGAWYQFIGNGNQYVIDKNNYLWVLAVRAF